MQTIALKTLIAASPMLGHTLEDRSAISQKQDATLLQVCQDSSRIPLRNPEQKNLFLVAPLDILVENSAAGLRFHVIEINGTGIGGLTNLCPAVIETVLANLRDFAATLPDSALALVAVSGMESSRHPRHNHLLHEKLLYVEALRRGLESRGDEARILTMTHCNEHGSTLDIDQPTIVLGYNKEFLNHLNCEADGRLMLYGRAVTAAVNDRFCLNAVSRFGQRVDLTRLLTLNRCFAAGADKGVAYGLLDEYAQAHPSHNFPSRIDFALTDSRTALVGNVVDWLRRGDKVVIKPQGTGLGHGLEFFLDPKESLTEIVARIDHSIRVTEHYYAAVGGAFPYTLCRFVDACTIDNPSHDFHGHRYELRIVVYRDGMNLQAAPSIAKVSSQSYDKDKATRLSLINNITASAEAKKREGIDFMLPLANRQTLELLKIQPDQLQSLCAYCAGFVRYVLDQVQDRPGRFGLPAN